MTKEDYEAIYPKMEELYEEHSLLRPGYYDEIKSVELFELLDASNLKFAVIDDNRIIGFIRGELVDMDGKKFAVVHDVFIDKLHRNKGTGSTAMSFFYKKARSAGATSVRLQVDLRNAEAVLFWRKEGFETTHLKMSKEID